MVRTWLIPSDTQFPRGPLQRVAQPQRQGRATTLPKGVSQLGAGKRIGTLGLARGKEPEGADTFNFPH